MKLYLSSYRIPVPAALFKLVDKTATSISVAVIPNAKDFREPTERERKLSALLSDLRDLKLAPEVVDLNHFQEPAKLQDRLAAYDVVFACGGNTYALRYAMRNSGFDKIIRQLLEVGIVYVGESAGAICAGRDLKGFEVADRTQGIPEIIDEGLGLIDTVIIPHVDNPEYADDLQPVIRYYQGLQKKPYLLKDSQALVVEGRSKEVVSA